MLAVKLARHVTQRQLIIKAWHGYHGSYDDLEVGLQGQGEVASAEVLYGPSHSYGSTAKGVSKSCSSVSACNAGCATTANPAVCRLSYINTVVVTGLRPNATYHFATKGVDDAGNVAQTNRPGGTVRDWTFLTGSP